MIFHPLSGPHASAPADEQARLLRLLAAHRLGATFGDALPPGSFNGPLAASLQQQPDDAGPAGPTSKGALYRRTLAIVQGVRRKARE